MSTPKELDCVEMKQDAQERLAQTTKGMTHDEEVEHWRRRSEAFRAEIEAAKAQATRKAS